MAFVVALGGNAFGQANLHLNLVAPPSQPIATGQAFDIKIRYRSASTTTDANNVQLVINIPAGIEFDRLGAHANVTGHNYDAGARTLTIDFVNPLRAGTTGEFAFTAKQPNGSTPDATTSTFTGTIQGSNTSATTANATVLGTASPKLTASKHTIYGEAVGSLTGYQIRVCNGDHGEEATGRLNMTNVVVRDVLPPSATYVHMNGNVADVVTSYDAGSRTAQWVIPNLPIKTCKWLRVAVEYPAATNSVGQTITNTAAVFGTAVGNTPVSTTASVTHQLYAPNAEASMYKEAHYSHVKRGGNQVYSLFPRTPGSEPLDNFAMIDVLPPGVRIYNIKHGKVGHHSAPVGNRFIYIRYKTNLNNTWRDAPGVPFNGYTGDETNLNDLGLSLYGAEYITAIKWEFGNVSSGFWVDEAPQLYVRVMVDAPLGTMTNCAQTYSSTPGATLPTSCANFEVQAGVSGTIHSPYVQFAPGFGSLSPFSIGDEVELTARMATGGTSLASMFDPLGSILLPPGLSYVAGSQIIVSAASGLTSVNFDEVENYGKTGQTLLRWRTTGELQPGDLAKVQFKFIIGNQLSAGPDADPITFIMSGRNPYETCWRDEIIDQYDVNGNGNTTETLCGQLFDILVNASPAVSAQLEVKGSLDNDFTSYPDVGSTLPGGLADYRYTITNEGNVAMTDVQIMDVFPRPGDRGVTSNSQRQSKWRPYLAGPVDAPSGVLVHYTTVPSPCRAPDGFINNDGGGCQAPAWTLVPPTDISAVTAIKIDFGSRPLNAGEQLVFEWPMRTPTDVLTQAGVGVGDVAFNSAGYLATESISGATLLPSEPLKTGLAIDPLSPGVIGNLVWQDDGDGIQEVGEPGVNGVRVELYRDNGDGIADVTTDARESFTITSSDGSYLFPGLSTGDYFLLFQQPPAYTLAPARQGSDPELDSDGVLYYANGRTGAITEVFRITNTEFDYSRDLGLQPSGKTAFGDYVWNDANANGIQDEGVSAGTNGVPLDLLSNTNLVIATTRTRPDLYGNPGYYLFDGIDPGSYRIQVRVPSGTTLSAKAQGSNPAADSDGDPSDNGRSSLITVVANEYRSDVDFALQLSGVEVCDNGIDDDGNLLIDCEDPACAGSTVCAPRFACDNTLYQTIKVGTDYWLYRVDVNPVNLVPLANLTAAGALGEINSTILNPRDGYIYTVEMRSPWRTYRITGDMAVVYLGDLSVPSDAYGFNAGAVDRNGNWLVRDFSTKKFLNIDINTLVATDVCDFSGELDTRNVGDFDYNPVDGFYYGTLHETDSLLRYDFATCTRDVVKMSRRIPESTGAFWVSADGIGYGYENATGDLIKINLQSGEIEQIGNGGPTAQTDGCSCQGVKLTKDATARLIRKGEVNTYEFTIYNRYFTNLNDAVFSDALPTDATWVTGPYDLTPGLVFGSVTGMGTSTLSVEASNIPQVVTSFKVDYIVDPSYSGAHPMPNQAKLIDLPVGIGSETASDDPTTESFFDPTLVHFVEHCANGIDDDVDGFTDCDDGECPNANPVLRIAPN